MTVAITTVWRAPLRALNNPTRALKLHSPRRGLAWQTPSFHHPAARLVLVRTYSVGQELSTNLARIPPSGPKEPALSDARPCHLSTGAVPKRPAQPSTKLPKQQAWGQNTNTPASRGTTPMHHSSTRMCPKQGIKVRMPT